MKCGTFSFERGRWIAKTKDRWKFLTFPPCKGGGVWGVECVLGPRHSCVESEQASRGSPLSLQLKGLAVIGTKALSSRFFSLLASLFCRSHTTATSMQASYLFWRVKFVLLGILESCRRRGKKRCPNKSAASFWREYKESLWDFVFEVKNTYQPGELFHLSVTFPLACLLFLPCLVLVVVRMLTCFLSHSLIWHDCKASLAMKVMPLLLVQYSCQTKRKWLCSHGERTLMHNIYFKRSYLTFFCAAFVYREAPVHVNAETSCMYPSACIPLQ